MKAVPAWLVFTVLRVLMFAVPFVILLLLGIEGWLAALLAAVIGLCLSYIFLRAPRDTVARGLYEVRHRDTEPTHPDAESEDAAVDRAEAGKSPAGQPSTGQTSTGQSPAGQSPAGQS